MKIVKYKNILEVLGGHFSHSIASTLIMAQTRRKLSIHDNKSLMIIWEYLYPM